MRLKPVQLLLVVTLLSAAGACSAGDGGGGGAGSAPPAVAFTKVELPAGAAPVVLAAAGDDLLIGTRRAGQEVVPGLLRLGQQGQPVELAVHGATPYGLLARWSSIAADGERIVGLGGERGGAHGHVRWSVWTAAPDGIAEQRQGFSTFGGYAAGDIVDAVLTPTGSALVGAWESAQLGFDVAVWTPAGEDWLRQSSAGTALESSEGSLGFPMAATAAGPGILVAGWGVTLGTGNSSQQPVVWRSEVDTSGWTRTTLPDGGRIGAALAARCWDGGCGVAGRADGNLAVWELRDASWARRSGLPAVPVGDRDRLAAPIEVGDRLNQFVSDGGHVTLAQANGDGWTVRPTDGPAGTVTAVTAVGDTLYLLAGPDEDDQTLWRADLAALG